MSIVPSSTSVGAGAYTSGKVVGGIIQFPKAVVPGPHTPILVAASLADAAAQSAAAELWLFSQSPANGSYADGATFNLNAADAPFLLGIVPFAASSYFASSGTTIGFNANLGFQLGTQPGSNSTVYGILVSRGTPNYGVGPSLTPQLNIVPEGDPATTIQRTVVNDADYTLTAADSVVVYTALSTNRTVTINPAKLVVNKIYTVKIEAQSLGKTYVLLNMASGTIDGLTAITVPGFDAAISFYTSDGTNCATIGSHVVRTFLAPTSNAQVICIGNGSVTQANVNSKMPTGWAQYAVIMSLDNADFMALFDIGAGSPQASLVGNMCLAISAGGGVLQVGTIIDGSGLGVIDLNGRGLYGFSGLTVAPGLQWDDAAVGFCGADAHPQIASANQTALTDSTGGSTANATLSDVGASPSQATINANFAKLAKLVNELRSDLVTFGLIKGSA